MSVARSTELTAMSTSGFDDALKQGIARARETLRNVKNCWVKDQEVVIGDPDQRLAAIRVIDRDPPRPRIQRVFHQFLDRRGRALHHLARRDLVGHTIRQDANFGPLGLG